MVFNSRKSKEILCLALVLLFTFAFFPKNLDKNLHANKSVVIKHKGKDFYIKLTKIETYSNEARVVMNSGVILPLLHEDGTSEPFKSEIWNPTDVEVQQLIPGSEREQIILYDKGSNQAPEVRNEFASYKVYLVEPIGLRKIADITTYNKVSGFFDHITISGSVIQKLEKGLPILEFRYVEEGGPERTKIYRWNGKVFVEDK